MPRSGFFMKNTELRVSIGQHSDKGRKEINQDFHGVYLPQGALLASKGIALAIADGISSSSVSQVASESAVSGFLADYYATTDTWSVKTSIERVLNATNAWLYAQTRQSQYDDKNHGYVCTLTGLVLKGAIAHIVHVGDTRIYRLSRSDATRCEQLTEDHRVRINAARSYLARALGISHRLDLDYRSCALALGDIFVLATDGVYEFISVDAYATRLLKPKADLQQIANDMLADAINNGSDDNLTIQIVRIDQLPEMESSEIVRQLDSLPCPPPLQPGMMLDGLKILHELKVSSRSHTFLAENTHDGRTAVLKVPSTGMRDDRAYLERFLIEDWVARRIDNPHVVRASITAMPRTAIYVATEYVDGCSLAHWMRKHPHPDQATLRSFMNQIARGLQALHRKEMLHQDLKPDNILIDADGTLKLIDFGATRVAGLDESHSGIDQINLLGAAQYAAPEYFLGEQGSPRADLYSLGVIAYQLLSGGALPYGTTVPKIRSLKARDKLRYVSLHNHHGEIPDWIDGAIQRAVHPDPSKRHSELSEFIHELSHPNPAYSVHKALPLIQRHPLRFWQTTALLLLCLVIYLTIRLAQA